MDTLFVAGPRHGTAIGCPAGVPPTFVDIASGETYTREQVSFTTLGADNKPDYLYKVCVLMHVELRQQRYACQTCRVEVGQHHATETGHPVGALDTQQIIRDALTDAVLRSWFISTGTREPAPGRTAGAGNAAANGGDPAPSVRYTAYCAECVATFKFDTLKARAEWASGHSDAAGHGKLTFGEELMTKEA